MPGDYLWGVHPRAADEPLVASGEETSRPAAQREVELVLGTKPQAASWGTVTGPRGCHLVCRRDGMGGFTWENPNGSRADGPARKHDKNAGRLYRDAQNDYWAARARQARRGLALRRLTRTAIILVVVVAVIVVAARVAHISLS